VNKIKKPLIFVGLNDNIMGENKDLYYNLNAKHKYYIKLDDKLINSQKCRRFLKDIRKDKYAMNDLENNNETFISLTSIALKQECDLKETIKMSKIWKDHYTKQEYKFISFDDIYNEVCDIISKYTISNKYISIKKENI
jgi:hypothetical protein